MKPLPLSLTSNLKRFFSLHNRSYNCNSITFKREHQLYSYISISRKDPGALAAVLSLSEKTSTLILGTQIHAYVVKFGFSNDIFTQNNLIKFYSKLCSLCDGFKVFDEMRQRNLVSWTLLINCAIQCGEVDFGLEMYLDMMRAGLMPNEFALASVMKACSNNNVGSEFGSSIHCFSMKIGMEKNPYVASSILTFYAKLGDIEAAENLFKSMDSVDTGCWNSMIGGYAQCGFGLEAMSSASLMQFRGITMDRYTFINALQGCSLAGDLRLGRQIHGVIITKEVGFNVAVMNSLMDMYFKIGGFDSGLKVFRSMHDRDIVTWNTVLGSFSRHENPKKNIGLFHDFMLSGLRPNHITISTLFRECGELCDIDLGLQFYCVALHLGLLGEAKIVPSLISMLTKCREMEMARLIFESIVLKDIIIWNELIAGYNLNCRYVEAFKTFMNLLESGVEANEYTFSNVLDTCCRSKNLNLSREIHGTIVKFGFASSGYVLNSLIRSYVTFGLLDESFKLFHGWFDQRLDIASWGTMISVLAHQGYYYQAIRFVNSLIESGERPDEFILGSILGCCAAIAAYLQTTSVHPFVVKLGYDRNGFVASALLDAYAKGGDIKSARMAFNQSTQCNDVIIYNAMITAYAHHGCIMEALDIFDQLKLANLQPSHATFVSVISACGHMGLIDEGCFLFESMTLEYGMKPSPDNYGCLVDMFSRNGFLEDAKRIIEIMPYPPWTAVLRSLLSGSRIHGNREMGEWAAKKLLQLDPENDAAHALLFNVYSEMGRWEDAVNVRREMTKSGVKKDPGHSWTVSMGNCSFS